MGKNSGGKQQSTKERVFLLLLGSFLVFVNAAALPLCFVLSPQCWQIFRFFVFDLSPAAMRIACLPAWWFFFYMRIALPNTVARATQPLLAGGCCPFFFFFFFFFVVCTLLFSFLKQWHFHPPMPRLFVHWFDLLQLLGCLIASHKTFGHSLLHAHPTTCNGGKVRNSIHSFLVLSSFLAPLHFPSCTQALVWACLC